MRVGIGTQALRPIDRRRAYRTRLLLPTKVRNARRLGSRLRLGSMPPSARATFLPIRNDPRPGNEFPSTRSLRAPPVRRPRARRSRSVRALACRASLPARPRRLSRRRRLRPPPSLPPPQNISRGTSNLPYATSRTLPSLSRARSPTARP